MKQYTNVIYHYYYITECRKEKNQEQTNTKKSTLNYTKKSAGLKPIQYCRSTIL